jgi:hypothetical protein
MAEVDRIGLSPIHERRMRALEKREGIPGDELVDLLVRGALLRETVDPELARENVPARARHHDDTCSRSPSRPSRTAGALALHRSPSKERQSPSASTTQEAG